MRAEARTILVDVKVGLSNIHLSSTCYGFPTFSEFASSINFIVQCMDQKLPMLENRGTTIDFHLSSLAG